jgi:hypothetical protein
MIRHDGMEIGSLMVGNISWDGFMIFKRLRIWALSIYIPAFGENAKSMEKAKGSRTNSVCNLVPSLGSVPQSLRTPCDQGFRVVDDFPIQGVGSLPPISMQARPRSM